MNPICVPCQRFFRADKTGVYFIEAMPIFPKAEPGTAHPEQWTPYKLWVGDRWKCEGCGAVIISGTAREPLAEHYQPDFAARVARTKASLQVNDC